MQTSEDEAKLSSEDFSQVRSELHEHPPAGSSNDLVLVERQDEASVCLEIPTSDVAALRRVLVSILGNDSQGGTTEDATRHIAKLMFEMRKVRTQLFPPSMFNEPAWDMLIALYISDEPPALTDLARSTNTPLSTANRWIDYLESHGFVSREMSATDRRSWLIRLRADARKNMHMLFSRVITELP